MFLLKFVNVFQFFNNLLEEMSRCNCFSLQLLGGGDSRRTLDMEAGVWLTAASQPAVSLDNVPTNLRAERGQAKSFIRYTKIPEMA